jgi:hypothetical protein
MNFGATRLTAVVHMLNGLISTLRCSVEMKMLISAAFGLLSSFVVYLLLALMLIERDWHRTTSPALFIWAFYFTWAISSLLLVKDARTIFSVFRRGFLLGAAEWLVILLAGVIYISNASGIPSPAPSEAFWGVSAGLASFGKFSFSMMIVCLAGFAIVHFYEAGNAYTRRPT